MGSHCPGGGGGGVCSVTTHSQPLGVPQELSGSSPSGGGRRTRRGHWLAGHLGDEKAEDLRRGEMIELRQQLDKSAQCA